MKAITSTNDWVIRFANINGSGSASANSLFAKAIFRMGIPVSPKNIFPSNIQGLPTWYEVRINEKGYLGRRGGYDFVVAVNGQTMRQDYDNLPPGGYFLYDATRLLPESYQRQDIILIPIPLTDICNREITEPRLRQPLKNIIYIGALVSLFNMDFSVVKVSIEHQFAKKPHLSRLNLLALELGYSYTEQNLSGICKLLVRPSKALHDEIIMDGNTATGLGAVYGGGTVTGWYPITPSTSVIESFIKFIEQFRRDAHGKKMAACIQAEDELAAIGIAIGASWNGARGFTATSGPGLSLMNEFLGLAYFAEIPVVLIDVQRAGPSTGMPTRTQQSDILLAAHASHGDTHNVLLFPASPKDCFEMTANAFDLADRLQTPVLLMSDLDLGMNEHICKPLTWDDSIKYDRGKILSAEELEALPEKWGRYRELDGDGICYRTLPGTHPELGAYFTRGTSHDDYSAYTEDNTIYQQNMLRLLRKWETAKDMVPQPILTQADKRTRLGILFFGSSTMACHEAADILEQQHGIALDRLQILAYPFSSSVSRFIAGHQTVFVVEQNRDGQLRSLLLNEGNIVPEKLHAILHFDGFPLTATIVVHDVIRQLHSEGEKHEL